MKKDTVTRFREGALFVTKQDDGLFSINHDSLSLEDVKSLHSLIGEVLKDEGVQPAVTLTEEQKQLREKAPMNSAFAINETL